MPEFDAIIFDCDGVLVDSEAIYIDEEIKLLAEMGLTYSRREYVERFMGLNNNDWIAFLREDYSKAGLGSFPPDFLERKRARTWPRIQRELQPIAGAKDLIDAFAGPVAAASSSVADRLAYKLEKTLLAPLFQPHIYSADTVENGKPAPDLFLFAARKLGVDPARCIVIEDSENGIRAGVAAGMYVIGFTGGGHLTSAATSRLLSAGAHQVFESHYDISKFLNL